MIESVPTGRLEMARVATPPTNVTVLSVDVPDYVVFLKVTDPLGVLGPEGVTTAVNVTPC